MMAEEWFGGSNQSTEYGQTYVIETVVPKMHSLGLDDEAKVVDTVSRSVQELVKQNDEMTFRLTAYQDRIESLLITRTPPVVYMAMSFLIGLVTCLIIAAVFS